MMIWLVKRLLLVIFPACALMTAALPTIAPQPDLMADYWEMFGFNACELPCWASITPDITLFEDATAALETHLPRLNNVILVNNTSLNFGLGNQVGRMTGVITDRGGQVRDIRLTTSIAFYGLVERLGVPDCVFTSDSEMLRTQSTSITVYWDRGQHLIGALVQNAPPQPTFHRSAHTISLWMSYAPDGCSQPETQPWIGFASEWYYHALKRPPLND